MTSTPVEKVFRCVHCQGIYLDFPVSSCDCDPAKAPEFTEMRLVSVEDFELLVKIKGIAAECGVVNLTIGTVPSADSELAAKRWNALINCARIRALGSSGLTSELDPYGKPHGNYGHLGLELWTIHPPYDGDGSFGREWLIKFADKAISAQEEAAAKAVPSRRVPCSIDGKVSSSCSFCDGTGLFQGRKCDGIPF